MPVITIDNIRVEVEKDTTILDAAAKAGIHIPTLCHLKGHDPQTSCMVCLVKITGSNKLCPACATMVYDGMVVQSETEEVYQARKTALELLLGDHRGDCIGPCQDVCPAHMDIPKMISLLGRGEYRKAIRVVKEHIALPAVLGRICPQICEKGCRRGQVDSPISICLLKRFAADVDLESGNPYLPEIVSKTGHSVAVIGSGPAGLSAAYYLAVIGHDVVVFDGADKPGGKLRSDIGEDKLPQSVLDAEIAIIEALGVDFRMKCDISDLNVLKEDHSAVVICTGDCSEDYAKSIGLKHTGKGLHVDNNTGMTDIPGIFAAGSSVSSIKHAVRACAQGRSVAYSITRYLRGESGHRDDKPFSVRMGKLDSEELKVYTSDASASGRTEPTQGGFSESEMNSEVARCLHCECAKVDNCRLRKESALYQVSPAAYKAEHRKMTRDHSHPDIVFEQSKCISCGLCIAIAQEHSEELGLTFIGRGFDVKTAVPFGESMPEALKSAAIECAEACPTAAIHLKTKDP